jgi:hypothetical protein
MRKAAENVVLVAFTLPILTTAFLRWAVNCPVRDGILRTEVLNGSPAMLLRYLKNLALPRLVLWCYLIWYLVMAVLYFDPTPAIWLTSLGLSVVIGIALNLSVMPAAGAASVAPPGAAWQKFRLFLIPFCVSSFATLVKGQGFVLIFSSRLVENALATAGIVAFLALWAALRRFA